MDFYGAKDSYVLGLIDLDSLWVELIHMDSRTAANVEAAVRDRILFRHGTPNQIQSDHAQEFVGKVMTSLAKNKEVRIHEHHDGRLLPDGQLHDRELLWSFLGVCLRDMTDAQYDNFDDHLQRIAWAWNVTDSESLSVSPFEVMTGTVPRTLPASAMQTAWMTPPDVGTDDNGTRPTDVDALREATNEYIKVAAEHGDFMRAERADRLNKRGRVLKALVVGDHVKIHMPPGASEAEARGRKAKHLTQFRGPLRIVDKPTSMTFVLQDHYNSKRRYRRHISNVRRWIGPLPDADTHDRGAEAVVS